MSPRGVPVLLPSFPLEVVPIKRASNWYFSVPQGRLHDTVDGRKGAQDQKGTPRETIALPGFGAGATLASLSAPLPLSAVRQGNFFSRIHDRPKKTQTPAQAKSSRVVVLPSKIKRGTKNSHHRT
jgi:hypothetical protein